MASGIETTVITLTATTQVIAMGSAITPRKVSTPIPVTVTVDSVSSPTISFSTDNGNTYYAAVTPTYTVAGSIAWVCTFPITNLKITGAINDTVILAYQPQN
jgi:hypothetical protein